MKKKKATASAHRSRNRQKPQGRWKLLLFKAITILLPVIFLALIEGLLRLSGYGSNLRLFTEYENNRQFLTMNEPVSQKYFTKLENATFGFDELFRKEKTAETIRIFVLGESTTIGFPYTNNGSFHRWLKYRLMRTFPETNFEIINLALTAVNSFTVFDFAKEVTKYEPDAVLIYVGHNEYYGALGVGSTSKLGNNVHLIRIQMNLRQLRLVQLIYNTINKIGKGGADKTPVSDQGLMERMAADYHIPYGSKKFEKGVKQFETNLNDVCDIFSGKKIPVFISNLVSNEKDLKPFISDSANNERSAAYQYELAGQAYAQGDFKLAKELYIKAKDLDLLRFRAPEEMNQVIDDIVNKYTGVYLVDTKSLFEKHSPHGILGKETILEHVHPNLFGYALLSESFYLTLKQQGFIVLQDRQEMSFEQLLEQMPVSKLDSLKGAYALELLMRRWPFNKPYIGGINIENSVEGELAKEIALGSMHWYNAMAILSKHYEETNNLKGAFILSESSVLEFPYDPNAYMSSARASLKMNDKKDAIFYLSKAFQLEPDPAKSEDIYVLLMETDQPQQALPFIDYSIEHDQSTFVHLSSRAVAEDIISLKSSLLTDSSNITLLNQIADIYWQTQNKEVSMKYVNKALGLNPTNKTSLEILKRIQALPD